MRNSQPVNHLERIRDENCLYFNQKLEIEGSTRVIYSPDLIYKVELKSFQQTKPLTDWAITEVRLTVEKSSELLFHFFVNERTFFHSWIKKDNQDFLLCAEDFCGGQTIINLTDRKMVSFTADDDGFIWTEHLLSPDEKSLAVIGCVRGSPYYVTVYDFSFPLNLTLPVIYESEYSVHELVEWIDNTTLKIKTSSETQTILNIAHSA